MSNTFKTVWLVLATLAPFLTIMTVSRAWADDKIVVRAGDSAVVARKTQAITNEKANLGSVAKANGGRVLNREFPALRSLRVRSSVLSFSEGQAILQ
jgi:hypothetical protein